MRPRVRRSAAPAALVLTRRGASAAGATQCTPFANERQNGLWLGQSLEWRSYHKLGVERFLKHHLQLKFLGFVW